jgi:hypothetical protein
VAAVFYDDVRMAVADIVACLRDSEWRVRKAAIDGISGLVLHCMYYYQPIWRG